MEIGKYIFLAIVWLVVGLLHIVKGIFAAFSVALKTLDDMRSENRRETIKLDAQEFNEKGEQQENMPSSWNDSGEKGPNFYHEYWTKFMAAMNSRPNFPLKPRKAPTVNNYIGWSCFGRKGFKLFVSLQENSDWICVNFGIDSRDQKHHFKELLAKQQEINQSIGEKLRWKPMGNERSDTQAILTKYRVDVRNRSDWSNQHAWMLDTLEIFYKVFTVHVESLGNKEI